MRMHVAAIVAVSLCASIGSAARAGSYYLEFSSLLAEQGQSVSTYSDQGFTLSGGFNVTGPNAPSYAGKVGLTPTNASWTLTDSTGSPIYEPSSANVGAVYFEVGAISGSKTFDLSVVGKLGGTAEWAKELKGTAAPGNFAEIPIGLAPVDTITITNLDSSTPYQVLDVTIHTLSVPEPPTAALGSIALVVGAVAVRFRSRRQAA